MRVEIAPEPLRKAPGDTSEAAARGKKKERKEDSGLLIYIKNGPGMLSEQLPRCFEGPEHCSSASGGVSGRSREVSARLLEPPGAPSGGSWGAPGASRRPFREYFGPPRKWLEQK